MIVRKLLGTSVAFGVAAILAGCPDTEGEFDKFIDRYEAINSTATATTGTGGGGGGCAAPAVGEADGDFVFVLSAKLNPTLPVLFDSQLTTADGASGLELSFTLWALDAKDRSTKVGSSLGSFGPYAVGADGAFTAALPPLVVVGEANPFSGTELRTENVVLTGSVCGDDLDLICGDVTGNVVKPITFNLQGSTFAFERLSAPGTYPPQPIINCAGDQAKPL
jgi:hypothetical protein